MGIRMGMRMGACVVTHGCMGAWVHVSWLDSSLLPGFVVYVGSQRRLASGL